MKQRFWLLHIIFIQCSTARIKRVVIKCHAMHVERKTWYRMAFGVWVWCGLFLFGDKSIMKMTCLINASCRGRGNHCFVVVDLVRTQLVQ
jgi:hypothetical protein